MRLRIRGPSGQSAVELADTATLHDLLVLIEKETTIQSFDIKVGYPPKSFAIDGVDLQLPLARLDTPLKNETLIISPKSDQALKPANLDTRRSESLSQHQTAAFSFAGVDARKTNHMNQIGLTKKPMSEVPELPLLDRGATLVLRVMPDDNSCLFRAFGTAVLPGDDLSMPELRALVASAIQADPTTYSKVVLEQDPDNYCRWIQTEDAWGGAIEIGILAKHFDIEVCSVDVQSLRVDKFNDGRPNRCILVYSGIHYDTIVQSPSDLPHTKAENPPEFDKRVWGSDDDEILNQALKLCAILRDRHYYTDTGSMAIRCNECQKIFRGESQAQMHASQTGHYDMAEAS